MRTWDGHEANSLAYMAAFSAYTCMWGMQHAVWGMQHVAACHEWHTNVAADSTRLDSTRLDFAPNCVPLSMACRLVALGTCSLLQRCLLPACCLFCLLKCRKCCGSQQAVARGTRAGKPRCNWQLATAPNGCKQQMLSACRHTHLCAVRSALLLSCNSDWNCTCLCRVAAADGVAALATGIETAIASAAIRFLLDNANSVQE